MIKASELRIGNIFHPISRSGEIHMPVVSAIGLFDIEYWHESKGFIKISNADICPVSLTEEWLLKFGFVDNGQGIFDYYHKNYQITARISKVGFVLRSPVNVPSGNITYVHQLQNLYFALTGEELTIKETTI